MTIDLIALALSGALTINRAPSHAVALARNDARTITISKVDARDSINNTDDLECFDLDISAAYSEDPIREVDVAFAQHWDHL